MTEARSMAVDLDPFHVVVPRSAWTFDGLRAWVESDEFPDGIRASWVLGELLIEMSPEAIDTHNTLKTELTVTLGAIARDEGLGEVYADGVLFTNEQAGVSTEPDLVFVSFEAIESGRVAYRPKADRADDRVELLGSPDLLVEIVSDSSTRKDNVLLRDAYARAGVREYWLLDARGQDPRFDILRLGAEEYEVAERSAVFDRAFELARSKNRVGRWSYRLTAV